MKKDTASSTAYTVVHGILHTKQNPQLSYLVQEDTAIACSKILCASKEGQKRLEELENPLKSKLLPLLEWLLMPGITLNYVLRKKYIEEKVHKAIKNGITQIINIGAGFDTLTYRLSSLYPNINFIEIDHPATSTEKIKAFNEKDSIENLSFISADLSKVSLEKTLHNNDKFDSMNKTLYISEGVLMYLPKEAVNELFNSLRRLTGKGSIFIFSCMEPKNSSKNNIRPLLYYYLKVKKEEYLWYIADTEVHSFINENNYSLLDIADSNTYRKKYLESNFIGTLHQGEYIVVTEVN